MINDIIKNLPASACSPGVESLINTEDDKLCELFYKYIDFCLAKNYPDLETIKKVDGHIDAGIIVSRKQEMQPPIILKQSIRF